MARCWIPRNAFSHRNPYVLLVNHYGYPGREGEELWVHMGQIWSEFLARVGVDKKCFSDNPTFARKAQEFNLVIHPWTERLEQSFVYATEQHPFQTALEGTRYLLCEVEGVEGIFSESVATADLAAHLGCDSQEEGTLAPSSAPPPAEQEDGKLLCYRSGSEAGLYTGLASFVMGIFLASFISFWFHRKRRRDYQDGSAVASGDDFADQLELT